MRERGFFEDPIHELHHLNATLFRAARIIVDTSLHLGEMTFEEAVTFMMDKAAMPEPVARAEVGRYCWWPTQASSYLTGCLEILAIRERYLARRGFATDVAARRARRCAAPVPRRDRVVGCAAPRPRGARGRGQRTDARCRARGRCSSCAFGRHASCSDRPRTSTCSPCSRSPERACTTLTRCRSPSPGPTWRHRNSTGPSCGSSGDAGRPGHPRRGSFRWRSCSRIVPSGSRSCVPPGFPRCGPSRRGRGWAARSRARGSGPRCVPAVLALAFDGLGAEVASSGAMDRNAASRRVSESSATSPTASPSWRREAFPSSSVATSCRVSGGTVIDIRSRIEHLDECLGMFGLDAPAGTENREVSPVSIPLLLDVDTGIDDALALLYACASPDAELVAVTCLSGNAALADTERNTRAVLELVGRGDVEVAAGRPTPLLRALEITPETHGPRGLGYAELPDPPDTGVRAVRSRRDRRGGAQPTGRADAGDAGAADQPRDRAARGAGAARGSCAAGCAWAGRSACRATRRRWPSGTSTATRRRRGSPSRRGRQRSTRMPRPRARWSSAST